VNPLSENIVTLDFIQITMASFLSYEKMETFFSNFSFLCLFFSMISYWINLSGTMSGNPLLKNKIPNKDLSSSSATLEFSSETPFASFSFGKLGIFLANASLFILLTLRWVDSGHFPLSNLYESLLFLAWTFTFFHLVLDQMTENRFLWLGAIIAPTALFTTAFANFSLPKEMQQASALVPALQSNWLMMHVTVMILSYAALIFGSLLSIAFLILTFSVSQEQYEKALTPSEMKVETWEENPSNFVSANVLTKFQWAQNLDNLSYRILGLGFPLLTIGILSGAVWANEAWGSYWSWDPKETWALLTWLVFAIYLHTRITKNWQGKKSATIAAFGFFVVWICYLGVNLLGEGLHSYGWLKL
jgi:cytochrome c-type biogenesis protein CcsB